MSITVFEHGAKRIRVYFEHVVQLDNPRVVQGFMNVILSKRMPTKKKKKTYFISVQNNNGLWEIYWKSRIVTLYN